MNTTRVIGNTSIILGLVLISSLMGHLMSWAHFHLDWVCEGALEVFEKYPEEFIAQKLKSLKAIAKC